MVLQGGLKKLTKKNLERLKARIVEAGFCAPFFIWDNAGALMILDGTQRRAALLSLEGEGWMVPPLPVVYIYAETEAEAREILLSVSSQYGEWVEDELAEWMKGIDDSIKETLRLVDVEINETIELSSTERGGQGVTSSWDQVKTGETIKIIIGQLESSIDEKTFKKVLAFVNSKIENGLTLKESIKELFNEILRD